MLCAALSAGFVDAIVGGGGLIQLPALLAGYPASPAARCSSGRTSSAASAAPAARSLRYLRVVRIPWRVLLPAAAVAFLAALAGRKLGERGLARAVSALGAHHADASCWCTCCGTRTWARAMRPSYFHGARAYLALTAIGGIGLYDGFFGPGTGSFLMLLFIRVYGFDFLHASAGARTINVATNAGALLFFGIHGEVHWGLGIALGACNATGSVLGAHTALRHGSKFVRLVFIAIVIALIAKTGVDAWSASHAPNVQASCASHRPGAPIDGRPSDARDGGATQWPGVHSCRPPTQFQ